MQLNWRAKDNTSLSEVIQNHQEEEEDKEEFVRVVTWNVYSYHLHCRFASVFQQILLDTSPTLQVVHSFHQCFQLLIRKPQHFHDAVNHSLGVYSLVENSFLDHLSNLSEVNRVVQLVVHLEEQLKGFNRQGIRCLYFSRQAKSQTGFINLIAILSINNHTKVGWGHTEIVCSLCSST